MHFDPMTEKQRKNFVDSQRKAFKKWPKEISSAVKKKIKKEILAYLRADIPTQIPRLKNYVTKRVFSDLNEGVDDDDFREILKEMEKEGLIEKRYREGKDKHYYIKE